MVSIPLECLSVVYKTRADHGRWKFIPRISSQCPQYPPTSTTSTIFTTSIVFSMTTIYRDQNSFDMAQNINNVQYVHMANPGVGQVPPLGQAYQLPLKSLIGVISTRRLNPDGRSTTLQKTNMGFGPGLKNLVYKACRDLAKDLMIARNYVPGARAGIYPDTDFQAIIAGMRR